MHYEVLLRLDRPSNRALSSFFLIHHSNEISAIYSYRQFRHLAFSVNYYRQAKSVKHRQLALNE